MVFITSWIQLIGGSPYTSADNIFLQNNITTDVSSTFDLGDATFEGNGFTIFFDPTRDIGIISNIQGGTVQNLTLDLGTATLNNDQGAFLTRGTTNNLFTFDNCKVVNFDGKIVTTGYTANRSTLNSLSRSYITNCSFETRNIALDNVAAFVNIECPLIDVSECYAHFKEMESGCAGIALNIDRCNIDCCEVVVDLISNDGNGGFSHYVAGSFNVTKSKTSFGTVNGFQNGGFFRVSSASVTINITDCYTNFTSTNPVGNGVFFYFITLGDVIFNRCYSTNTQGVNNIFHDSNFASGITCNDCYIASSNYYTSNVGTTFNFIGGGTTLVGITNNLPSPWSTNVWTPSIVDGLYPELKCFTPSVPCFLPGTMIKTKEGDQSIETLNIGDLVKTQNGFSKITEHLIIKPSHIQLEKCSDIKPVCLTINALGENLPVRDTWMSRFHKFSFEGKMISCNDLFKEKNEVCKFIKDTYHDKVFDVEYHHLQLEKAEDNYYANDMMVESIGEEHDMIQRLLEK